MTGPVDLELSRPSSLVTLREKTPSASGFALNVWHMLHVRLSYYRTWVRSTSPKMVWSQLTPGQLLP